MATGTYFVSLNQTHPVDVELPDGESRLVAPGDEVSKVDQDNGHNKALIDGEVLIKKETQSKATKKEDDE